MLFEDFPGGDAMEWSMNGGDVVFGAAGVALSPRLIREGEGGGGGRCCCECKGLGLYVIEEEEDGEGEAEAEEVEEGVEGGQE